jgi:hypothetical protein
MNFKPVAALALATAFTLFAAPAWADLTAENAQADRGHFNACVNASHHRHDSVEAHADAVTTCAASALYYATEADASKDESTRCIATVYSATGSFYLAYFLHESGTAGMSSSVYANGVRALNLVITSCPGEPNITAIAKAMLSGNKTIAKALGY